MARNIFNSVQMSKVPRNTFDHGHDNKLSLNMGKLVPIYCAEALPGDTFNINTSAMLRLAPMLAPIMHKVNVFTHFYFIPNRILWNGWEKFIAAGLSDAERPALPSVDGVPIQKGSLADYMGLPITGNLDKFSALPFAAYQAIYNEYYRDQNLIPEVDYTLQDGAISAAKWNELQILRTRAWQHDYFTASLPFAQKGDPVTLPIGNFQDVPVNINRPIGVTTGLQGTGSINPLINQEPANNPDILNDFIYAKTSSLNADATTINDLRTAIRLQEWFERNARGGTRYTESLYAHFGVRSRDSRLQRPEYIGGTMNPMVISEVLQTAPGTETTPTAQGNMSGHGISVGSGKVGKKFCDEHGYVIGIMSIMPVTAYQQGIPKHFSKFDPFDFAFPNLAHLGEQEVKNRELFYSSSDGLNDATFGYVPRYAEYKYHDSRVAGDFRDNLSFWHMGRIFENRPNLNQAFIEANPTNRIFAVVDDSVDKVYAHVFNNIRITRALPVYGTPRL